MIKSAVTNMARYAKLPPPRSLTMPMVRSPMSCFLPALAQSTTVALSPHLPHKLSPGKSGHIMTSLSAVHHLSLEPSTLVELVSDVFSHSSCSGSTRRSIPCFTSQIYYRSFSAPLSLNYSSHSCLQHSWIPETSGRRGFASSVKDGATVSSSGGNRGLSPPAATPSGEGSVSGESPGSIVNVAESTRQAANSFAEMVVGVWEASKEAATQMFPAVDNWMDPSGGGIAELVIPASSAIGVSLVAWIILPKILRQVHSYVESGPTARLLGRLPQEKQPYELSVFSAMDKPARLLATTVTFSYLGYILAPTTITAQYLTQIWSGATVLSLIFFLHRWKTKAFTRMLSGKTLTAPERERYLTMDRLSSVGLLVLGGMALAEACGVAVQSVLTVGGIGGVATAFAARDILGNMLSGVALQFSRPFTIGDSITAGSVSGRVVEMGLHTTQLLNSDNFPIVVPNSYFSNQVIINKSRARYRGLSFNLPVHIQDLEKIPGITNEIRKMMMSHSKVYLENEKPRCHISQVGPASLNIAVTCNLKPMGTDEFLIAGEELLIEAARIVAQTGATLGAPA